MTDENRVLAFAMMGRHAFFVALGGSDSTNRSCHLYRCERRLMVSETPNAGRPKYMMLCL